MKTNQPLLTGNMGKPLLMKLGLKPGMKVWLVNQPYDYYSLLKKNITDP